MLHGTAKRDYMREYMRKRRAGEQDRFLWYCPACDTPLHQAVRQVGDWRDDPVSEVYAEFYGSAAHRTCRKCGHVAPGQPASVAG